jgi:PAS domain S-box-containing protein
MTKMDNLPCGYLSTSLNGIIIKCNSVFLAQIGYQKEEVVNIKKIQDFLTDSGRIYMEIHYAPLLNTQGSVKEVSFEFVCKDGSKFPALLNSMQAKDDASNYLLSHHTVFDITQQKKNEAELLKSKTKSDELLENLVQSNKELEKSTALINEQKEKLEKLNLFLQEKNHQLFDSEAKFKSFFESSQGLLSTHDLQGNFLSVNDAFADSLGYTKEEVLKLGLVGTTTGDSQEHIAGYLERIKVLGSTKGQVIAKHKDGSERIWMYSAVLEKNAYGEEYVIGNSIDITEIKRAEKELENRQNLLANRQKILNQIAKTPFIESKSYQENLQSITKLASEGIDAERASVWHYSNEGIVCMDLFDKNKNSHSPGGELLVKDYPNYFKGIALNEPIAAVEAASHKYTFEFAESYLGPLNILSMLDVPLRIDGKLIGIVCFESVKVKRNWNEDDINFARSISDAITIFINLSEVKEANANLEILSDNLQKKNQQLLNFAHITSHNLRSPVSNLNSLLGFYKESTSIEDKELLFTKFEKVIHHLSETLNELIESLKIREDVGRKLEWVNFEEVFTKTKEILAGQIMETKTVVTADFSEAEGIEYPKSYLESIILNLFSNGIKYRAPDRNPVIHFQTKKSDEGIILTATDNGQGIDLEKHGHKLFGLNKTFHKHAEAKGVGLFITKTQVEAMGGHISAESEVNKRTTFKILFKNKQ